MSNSVTNPFGQRWDAPNVFVMDGSLMPTGGAINPTSTIGSVAFRCADHLATAFRGDRAMARLCPGGGSPAGTLIGSEVARRR